VVAEGSVTAWDGFGFYRPPSVWEQTGGGFFVLGRRERRAIELEAKSQGTGGGGLTESGKLLFGKLLKWHDKTDSEMNQRYCVNSF
jgi:hypothetical protein